MEGAAEATSGIILIQDGVVPMKVVVAIVLNLNLNLKPKFKSESSVILSYVFLPLASPNSTLSYSNRSTLVHFHQIRFIWFTSVLSGPLQFISVHFNLIWSSLVYLVQSQKTCIFYNMYLKYKSSLIQEFAIKHGELNTYHSN